MGGDIVVSNRGCPPLIVYCFVLSLALVPTILCTMNEGKSQQTSTAGNKIALHSDDLMGQTSFIWTDQGAIRRQSGSVDMTFPGLPRPPGKAISGPQLVCTHSRVVVLFGFISALGYLVPVPTWAQPSSPLSLHSQAIIGHTADV